jgi:hypothetical protein
MVATANGRARRFWFDPRFGVGILLILASVVGVCLLLASQNHTVQVYVARTTLVAGARVGPGDVELVGVRVPDSGRYLAGGRLHDGAVVVRSVPKGELVPASALGEETSASVTSVVVKASGPVAGAVAAGAVADVWGAHAANDRNYTPPLVLVSGAIVVSVSRDEALVADRRSVSVELRVPQSRVARVLQAIADGQVISVVPASGDAALPRDSPGPGGADSGPGAADGVATPPAGGAAEEGGTVGEGGGGSTAGGGR